MESAREVRRWEKSGRPVPPPHPVKVRTVKAYAARFGTPVLVETGTYYGDMVFAVRSIFRTILSIELDEDLYRKAKARFAHFGHIHIMSGDSGRVLPKILPGINQRCLFWLDAHYSGGVSARGNTDTPIMEELQHILAYPVIDPVILIDDARLCVGRASYPTLDELRRFVSCVRPDWVFEVRDDIVRIHRPSQIL